MDVTPVPSIVTATAGQTQAKSSAQNQRNTQLSSQEQQEIQKLQARDREVRAHEAAHVAAGSGLTQGGVSFTYQKGADGKQYAIGGEVNIDTSEVSGDPQATLKKAQQIKAAALAPTHPSSQDRSVAAKAAQMAVQARAELRQQPKETSTSVNSDTFNQHIQQTEPQFDFTV